VVAGPDLHLGYAPVDAPEPFCELTDVRWLLLKLNCHCREEGADIRAPSST
jgi:hypothetical protein